MAKSRAEQFTEIGLEAYQGRSVNFLTKEDYSNQSLVRAIAAMLAEATKPKSYKTKDQSTLCIAPKDFYEAVRDNTDVLCVPYNKRWFSNLGRQLQAIDGLEPADTDRVVAWIVGGGFRGWPTQVTFDHVIKHLPSIVMKARKAEGMGHQHTLVKDLFD